MCAQQRMPTALSLLERAVGEMRASGELRENARLLNNLGKQAAAVALLCNDEKVSKVLPECVKPETLPAEPQVSYNPQTKSTRVVGGSYVH